MAPEHRWRERGESPQRPGSGFRDRLREIVEQTTSESVQTNAFYFIFWQEDGTIAARSPWAPESVPRPELDSLLEMGTNSLDLAKDPGPGRSVGRLPVSRSRGELRESYRSLPFGEFILVGRSVAPDLSAMGRLAVWLVAAGAGILLLGLAGGWWVTTRAIRPVNAISATAVKIAAGDLSQRINAADTQNELGRLAGVLNSTFARLEAAFANQARFTSDASHELRTPICVILSQTQMALTRERSAAEYRDVLEACQRSAQRMRKLTASLLELARLDAGQETLRHDRFDLAELARECVDLIEPLAKDRALSIVCELSPTECIGDAERLAQVVTNLLSNAMSYNRDQGRVTVTTRGENQSAILVVSDTGLGISPEDLPHVFERFYRGDKARSGAAGHTGLGLAISKAIVDAHGGVIEASGTPGQGATFTVRLPTGVAPSSAAGLDPVRA